MAPDLNSLPPSHSPDVVLPRRQLSNAGDSSPSRRSSSVSLQAAATINAGMQNQDTQRASPGSTRARGSPQLSRPERHRSNVAMTLNLNDPALPAPGELQGTVRRPSQTLYSAPSQVVGASPGSILGDPHHQRAPSLGDLHQELEQEQEAQVNRLLHMIRQQQIQLQNLQNSGAAVAAASVIEDSTPTSERSMPPITSNHTGSSQVAPGPLAAPLGARNRSPANRTSNELSRRSSYRSRRSSRDSPSLQPLMAGMHMQDDLSANRDECAFYQAETQNLTRENQMLRLRIRELERQLNEVQSAPANAPTTSSNLSAPPMETLQERVQEQQEQQEQPESAAIAVDTGATPSVSPQDSKT